MKARKINDSLADLIKNLENEEDSDHLRDDLNVSQHFFTDIEMENGHPNVFSFHYSKLDPFVLVETLDRVFEKFDCAAKISTDLGFVLGKIGTVENFHLRVIGITRSC